MLRVKQIARMNALPGHQQVNVVLQFSSAATIRHSLKEIIPARDNSIHDLESRNSSHALNLTDADRAKVRGVGDDKVHG